MSEPIEKAPAIGYSVTANIGGDRQLVMQCFVGEGETDVEVNAKLDRVMDLIERQQARADLPQKRRDLAKQEQTLQRMRDDKDALDRQFERDMAARDVGITALRNDIAKLDEQGRQAFASSGRQGDYKPSQQTKASIERIEAQVKAAAEEKARLTADREVHVQNYAVSEARHAEEVERMKAEIADLEGKLKGT